MGVLVDILNEILKKNGRKTIHTDINDNGSENESDEIPTISEILESIKNNNK